MGSLEMPEDNSAPTPENTPATAEKGYTDPLELWRALQSELDRPGMTQTALANNAGVHGTQISAVLKSLLEGSWPRQNSQRNTLAKMAEHLGIKYTAPEPEKNASSYHTPRNAPQKERSGPREYRTSR